MPKESLIKLYESLASFYDAKAAKFKRLAEEVRNGKEVKDELSDGIPDDESIRGLNDILYDRESGGARESDDGTNKR